VPGFDLTAAYERPWSLESRIDAKIGGLMGLGGDPVITYVVFERNQYYPGDKVNVKIICDNTKCGTAVKSFKLKFKRKVFMIGERLDSNGVRVQTLNKQSKYLYQHKDVDHGCAAKTKVERLMSFDIPMVDFDFPESQAQLNCTPHDVSMMQQTQASVNGQLLTIQYSVKVFVRHDSKQQFGEGECVTLPIRVIERPMKQEVNSLEHNEAFRFAQLPKPANGFKTCTNARS